MSETMKQSGQQQPTTPTPEASGGQGAKRGSFTQEDLKRALGEQYAEPKLFTQEDLDRIIGERLARERAKGEPSPEDEREQALKAREARLDCREYLDTQVYPAALLDVLDSSDTAKFKAAVDKLVKAFPAIAGGIRREGWKPGENARKGGAVPDPIAVAFKPKI